MRDRSSTMLAPISGGFKKTTGSKNPTTRIRSSSVTGPSADIIEEKQQQVVDETMLKMLRMKFNIKDKIELDNLFQNFRMFDTDGSG